MITAFYQNGKIGLLTTERLIFVNTNKSKSMTVKACSYISSIGRVCGCVRAEGGSVTGGGAGARPQLPVLPSEVATSSSAASSHTARAAGYNVNLISSAAIPSHLAATWLR